MGILGAIKNKITHRDEYEDLDVDATRSQVLGEPVDEVGTGMDEYIPKSRYVTPAAARFNPVRTYNIGPPEEPPAGLPVIGRTANDLMPADRFANENPMFAPASPQPFQPFGQELPPTIPSPSGISNERLLEKIEYLREDIKSLKVDIELLSERIKNIQARIEARRY